MSKVEMDMTEYNEIMEHKKQLQEALEREKELNNEINKLKEEKISILKNNEKKVTKVIKTVTHQHLKVLKPREDLIRILAHIVDDFKTNIHPKFNNWFTGTNDPLINQLNYLFDTSESISEPTEEITTQGLDEYIIALKDELHKELDKDIKYKLEEYVKLSESYSNLNKNYKILELDKKALAKENKKIKAEVEDLKLDIDYHVELIDIISKIEAELYTVKTNIFNRKLIAKLKELVYSIQESDAKTF